MLRRIGVLIFLLAQVDVLQNAINTVFANGVSYFSAAGNDGADAYESAFKSVAITSGDGHHLPTGTYHNFALVAGVTTPLLKVELYDSPAYLVQWVDRWFSISGYKQRLLVLRRLRSHCCASAARPARSRPSSSLRSTRIFRSSRAPTTTARRATR